MNHLIRALTVLAMLSGCQLGDVVSMTIEQRETETIPGLDLDDRVRIYVGDIESNDLSNRVPNIDEFEVTGGGQVLAYERGVRNGDRVGFVYERVYYEIEIDHLHTHLVWDDEVDLTVRRLR